MTAIHEAFHMGQSIWLDYINKELVSSGGLQEWINLGVTGVTTNPSIFENAIAKTSDYDGEIKSLSSSGKSTAEIYEALTVQEVGAAADIMRQVYDRTNGKDGYVSLEVNPLLASDRETTISEAKRLFALLNRPNVMIKIPATPEGISALTECIASGVNVNSTLIFSHSQYVEVAKAYLEGIKRAGSGRKAASVASVFVSRVDGAVDKLLAEKGETSLCGRIAVDGIKLMYQEFKGLFAGAEAVQRPLWASTGTKNKAYSDVKYVEELIGPDTVNTVPPATLEAFVNHGKAALTLETGIAEAESDMKRLAEIGVNLNEVCAKLLADGLKSFNAAFESLMSAIERKAG
ncbi:MAG: transaldolase [Synergistaceae bacterium]|nr:transaldolase [Synergistaceae bacterium]